jgi:hypothetical protein
MECLLIFEDDPRGLMAGLVVGIVQSLDSGLHRDDGVGVFN